ncbi:DUF3093 domain-containing protein [Lacisediminihabitans changchengi]|uniref:DUF3093 domain-containing protein n=1 Tax=Lacisediminihabitans changchengi TaxID=2787634 RepID=A0A934SU67_9MICO|nr:DUF3093 domain-containing protein [Lacisediminihabitans changchengi]MBK4346728.1 DUF3093 domain-containing protein [Lacisediminihabitans changchengi]MBK4348149.1 DUF3093 domain-containing protein [Lacisediminihabitans changchengi]
MTIYRERLWASPLVFISTALIIPASLLVFLPINPTAGVFVAILLYLAIVAALILGSPVLRVTDDALTAGRATIPLVFVGELTAYRGEAATLARGRKLDARAWLLIRGWVSPVAKIDVLDPEDPTPYWLVSTRKPEALIEAISSARARVEGSADQS